MRTYINGLEDRLRYYHPTLSFNFTNQTHYPDFAKLLVRATTLSKVSRDVKDQGHKDGPEVCPSLK